MTQTLSSCRTALRVEAAKRSQSHVLSSFKCADRLMLTRLQTAVLFSSCGRVISVQRFERWMVLVLLLSARTLIVSFQVSHGWLVAWSEIRIERYCSRAFTLAKSRIFPASAKIGRASCRERV